jgi:HAD superfamily hydrolase (TIGR01549 family)
MIKNVIFDAYGTLVDIKDKNHPYRLLYADLVRAYQYPANLQYPSMAMTFNGGINAFIRERIGTVVNGITLQKVEQALYNDLASIRKYQPSDDALYWLKDTGYNLGICSNLAMPYTVALDLLFPKMFDPDHRAMSCEVGATKPDPAIYAAALGDWNPEETLFVGDTYTADVVGPRTFGMHAVHLDRASMDEDSTSIDTIWSLDQICEVISAINNGSTRYRTI